MVIKRLLYLLIADVWQFKGISRDKYCLYKARQDMQTLHKLSSFFKAVDIEFLCY